MRTPTLVCLTALASAVIAAPTAVVAHDALTSDGLGLHASSFLEKLGVPEAQTPGSHSSGGTADSTPAAQSASGTTTRASATQAKGVVMIETVLPGGEGAGTGITLTADGTVVTNYHVVSGSTQIRVSLPNGHSYMADVVGHDQSHDLAVLKLRGASGLPVVRLDSDGVKQADSVLAVGQGNGEGVLYAAAGAVTDTDAQVTAQNENSLSTSETLTGLIRMSAPIVPGYSGGPLFDAEGEVIGIDTAASSTNSLAGYSSSESTTSEGFAIPMTQAKPIIDDILAGKKTSTNHLGKRASLGIAALPTTQNPTRPGQESTTSGVQVQGVISGQGAAAAGIEQGDTLTSIAGHRVRSSSDLSSVMDQQTPGSTVTVTWVDALGSAHSASVHLATSTTN